MWIPLALIYARLLIGAIILVCSLLHIDYYAEVAITLLSIGVLTDIFDGIIARRLAISTQKLRRLDSSVDQIFFICVVLATYIQYPAFFQENFLFFILLVVCESLTYLVSYLRFRKEIATHSIGAKIWTLVLFATLVDVMLDGKSPIFFPLCFWLGILTRAEILAIILTLKEWTNDVPSLYHALKLRQGKAIRRNKLFNG